MDRLAKRLMKIAEEVAEEIEVEAAYGRFDDMNPMTKPCPSCPGTMNYDFNNKSYRCTRCHHYERVQPRYFQGGEKRAFLMREAGYGNAKDEQMQDADEQRQIEVGQIPQKIASELMRVARLLEAADDMVEFRRSVSLVISDMDGFKAWFDKKAKDRGWFKQFLHSSGDTGAHETLFLDALERARESVETIWVKLNESDETPFQIKFSKGRFRNLKEWLADLSNVLKGEKIGGVDAAQFIHHVENMEYWWRKVAWG